MDHMKRTAISSVTDKNPLGPKAARTQVVDMERAASKGAGNKLGGSKQFTEADRVFQIKWYNAFAWVKKLDVKRDEAGTNNTFTVTAMFCKTCEAAGMRNIFTSKGGGCTSMRKVRLTEHEGGDDHRSAVEQVAAAREFKIARYKVFDDEDHKMLNLAVQVYGVFKNNDSVKSFANRCFLTEISSVQVKISDDPDDTTFKCHTIDLGESYRNPHFASEMGWCISNVLKQQQAKRVSNASVFSHAIDEATDRGKKSSLIQYICFVEKGEAKQEFANLIPIEKADAESIFDADSAALAEMFGGNAVEMHKKHVSFSSDGASVMTGKENGVAARYKGENPHMISIHCSCHKSALCGTGASENVPEIGDVFKKRLHLMYNHFNLSVKKRVAFAKAQRKLDMKEAQMKKDFFTRWLSLGHATQSARRNVLPLHKYLTEEDSDLLGDTAPELLKTLESHEYLFVLVAMDDILAKLNMMNLMMQKNSTSFRSVCIY